MLEELEAIEFQRAMTKGKTSPGLFVCSDADGNEIEVVVKFSHLCELKEQGLAYEAICAALAADLQLPVPHPYIVKLDDDFVRSIPIESMANVAFQSNRIAFGSKLIPAGFHAWLPDDRVPNGLVDCAAEIFMFDALLKNADRRPENPNCQYSGDELVIFDHELCFLTLIGDRPAWELGGLDVHRTNLERHIFSKRLKGRDFDSARFESAWKALTDTRIAEYGNAIPPAWGGATHPLVTNALTIIRDSRDHIEEAIVEGRRVLA